MSRQILICLYLLREEERKECLVNDHLSFREILERLSVKDLDRRLIVEKRTGFLCDPDVSLRSLNARDCMRFLIY